MQVAATGIPGCGLSTFNRISRLDSPLRSVLTEGWEGGRRGNLMTMSPPGGQDQDSGADIGGGGGGAVKLMTEPCQRLVDRSRTQGRIEVREGQEGNSQ